MYLIIDNYDSFTYNIFQYMTELTEKKIKVVRNNRITIEEIVNLHPEGIIISPGPGRPVDAGISLDAVKHFAEEIPIYESSMITLLFGLTPSFLTSME